MLPPRTMQTISLSCLHGISDSTKPSFLQVIQQEIQVCVGVYMHKHACVCSSDILLGIGRFRNKVQDSETCHQKAPTLDSGLWGKSASLVMHC